MDMSSCLASACS